MAPPVAPPKAFSLTKDSIQIPNGANVLVTGASSGIGLATAELLHSLSPSITLTLVDRNPPPPQSVLAGSGRALHIPCDITSWRSQRAAFQLAATHFGHPLSAVFVNAGLAEYQDQIFADTLDSSGLLAEPDRRTVDVDLRAALDSVKLALHHLRRDRRSQRGGAVVLTASLAGYLASAGAPLYSAAKHGVVGLMRALKQDCAKVGVGVSVVAPGITLTPIVLGRREGQSLDDWGGEMRAQGVPINAAETVALAVAHLVALGDAGNGMGLLVQGDRMVDLEKGIAGTRAQWMGEEHLRLFRGGRGAALFPNKL